MRLTIRTNLAMRTLMFCAVNDTRVVRKHDVAAACAASENHLAQVIHLLAQNGFLHTLRGRSGGLTLGRPADQISVGAVFRTFEAPLPFTDCFSGGKSNCPLVASCRLKCLLATAVDAFYTTLDRHTIADLVHDNKALHSLLMMA